MKRRQTSRSRRRKTTAASMHRLLLMARTTLAEHPGRSTRYVALARVLGMKTKVRIPAEWKRMICRRCNTYLAPGRTSRIRLRRSRVNVTCLKCGKVHRYPYSRRST